MHFGSHALLKKDAFIGYLLEPKCRVDLNDGCAAGEKRVGRLQRGEPVPAQPVQDAADGGWRYPDFGGDLLAGVAPPAQRLDRGKRGRWGLATSEFPVRVEWTTS